MSKKAVVYYRSRSAEPEASIRALESQRESVRQYVERGEFIIECEFIEDEGADENRPAYLDAVRHASSLSREDESWANLIVATDEPIGTGMSFRSPEGIASDELNCLHHVLNGPLQPFPPTIELPPDAPDSVCLFVAHAANPTLAVYLCNPTVGPLRNVKVTSTLLFTGDVFFSCSGAAGVRSFKEVGMEQIGAGNCEVQKWDLVPARQSVLVGMVYTRFNDGIPWYLIEHSNEHGTTAVLYGDLFARDPSKPFHVCVPGVAL